MIVNVNETRVAINLSSVELMMPLDNEPRANTGSITQKKNLSRTSIKYDLCLQMTNRFSPTTFPPKFAPLYKVIFLRIAMELTINPHSP